MAPKPSSVQLIVGTATLYQGLVLRHKFTAWRGKKRDNSGYEEIFLYRLLLESECEHSKRVWEGHTCDCWLELSTTYYTYPEFKPEHGFLNSAVAWPMDAV